MRIFVPELRTKQNPITMKTFNYPTFLCTVKKETEKAYQLSYKAEVSGELIPITAWYPKSQVEITEDEGRTYCSVKNDWIYAAKARDYAKWAVANGSGNLTLLAVSNGILTASL